MKPGDLTKFLRVLRRNGVVRYSDGTVSVEFGDGSLPPRSRGKVDLDPLEEEPKDPILAAEEDLSVDADGVPAAMRPVF